jgi:DNA-binding beta-propeller fold protein YncE
MHPPASIRLLAVSATLLAAGCADRKQVILIADAGHGRIVQMDDFDGSGLVSFAYPSTNPAFISPTAIAVDSQGRIYATSAGDDTISRMDDITGAGFVRLGRSGAGVGEFAGPFGIAVDSRDRIYVVDSDNDRIVRMDGIDGSGWTALGRTGTGQGEFREPIDVALDSRGRIYVADRGNHRLVRFDDMAGSGWTTYGRDGLINLTPGVIDLLGGVAVAPEGRIYYSDVNQNVVVSIADMSGAQYAFLGPVGASDSLFAQPTGLWADGSSPVYVASENNSRIGRFEDIQGTGYATFGASGAGQGQLEQPLDVVVATVPKP